jgi:nickel-dependent lactate racemase
MIFKLHYGHGHLDVLVPDANISAVLEPRSHLAQEKEIAVIRRALAQPIGSPALKELVHPGQRVAIITSDLTRPCPSERLLPPLLDELTQAGIPDQDITIILALGLHRPMTEPETSAAVGPALHDRVRVVNHDPQDVIRKGITSQGTPVEIFRPVVEADVRICVGNLELHYFAGFSGGAKAILPGCASRATVQANHAMMVQPEACAGRLDGNPVRADLEEGAAMVGADFILNVIVDNYHSVVGAVAGDVTLAHRQGCSLVAKQGIVPISELADIVLVSAGGFPKDVNLYQAQKALDNAAHAVRQGGTIILLAKCSEGLGNATFEAWLQDADSPDEILDRIQRKFILGGHKAAAVASALKKADVYLVSSMPVEAVERCGLVPFDDVQPALESAFVRQGNSARVVIVPQGGSVLPVQAAASS